MPKQSGPACLPAGQSLIEVLIALTVTIIMIVALIAFVLSGLKNAQFAQNQSKATRLAQETMEQIKTIRDRDGEILFTYYKDGKPQKVTKFSELWQVAMSDQSLCRSNIQNKDHKCYFYVEESGRNKLMEIYTPPSPTPMPARAAGFGLAARVDQSTPTPVPTISFDYRIVEDRFRREVIFEDNAPLNYRKEKRVTIRVLWSDSTGEHESNIQTILSPAI